MSLSTAREATSSSGSVRIFPEVYDVDCPTHEFTRGDAFASAHLAQLLHALARHQVLLAHEIFGFCRHTRILRLEFEEDGLM